MFGQFLFGGGLFGGSSGANSPPTPAPAPHHEIAPGGLSLWLRIKRKKRKKIKARARIQLDDLSLTSVLLVRNSARAILRVSTGMESSVSVKNRISSELLAISGMDATLWVTGGGDGAEYKPTPESEIEELTSLLLLE